MHPSCNAVQIELASGCMLQAFTDLSSLLLKAGFGPERSTRTIHHTGSPPANSLACVRGSPHARIAAHTHTYTS